MGKSSKSAASAPPITATDELAKTETASSLQKETNETETNKETEENSSTSAPATEGEGETPTEEKKKRVRKRKQKTQEETTIPEILSNASLNALCTPSQIYIEGLPFDSNEEAIRSFFESYGVTPILSMRLQKWQDTGRLRGNGHIELSSEAMANKAINEISGKCPPGTTRYVKIAKPNAPKGLGTQTVVPRAQPKNCSMVFVKNLPYDCTEKDVLDAFMVCGKIIDDGVRLVTNQNNQVKGFAYVSYKTTDAAMAAVKKASKPFGLTVKGRPVFVDFEENKAKNSFKMSTGQQYNKVHKEENPQKRQNTSSGPKL